MYKAECDVALWRARARAAPAVIFNFRPLCPALRVDVFAAPPPCRCTAATNYYYYWTALASRVTLTRTAYRRLCNIQRRKVTFFSIRHFWFLIRHAKMFTVSVIFKTIRFTRLFFYRIKTQVVYFVPEDVCDFFFLTCSLAVTYIKCHCAFLLFVHRYFTIKLIKWRDRRHYSSL